MHNNSFDAGGGGKKKKGGDDDDQPQSVDPLPGEVALPDGAGTIHGDETNPTRKTLNE